MNAWFWAGVLWGWCWLVVGACMVTALRRDLASETWTALLNCVLWPAGVFVQLVLQPIHDWRRERQRQKRIAIKVATGAYSAEFARDKLRWRG